MTPEYATMQRIGQAILDGNADEATQLLLTLDARPGFWEDVASLIRLQTQDDEVLDAEYADQIARANETAGRA